MDTGRSFRSGLCKLPAPTYFRLSTIIGPRRLNFRVRDGIGWVPGGKGTERKLSIVAEVSRNDALSTAYLRLARVGQVKRGIANGMSGVLQRYCNSFVVACKHAVVRRLLRSSRSDD